LVVVEDIFTKFCNLIEVILACNMPFNKIQESRWCPGRGFDCLECFF